MLKNTNRERGIWAGEYLSIRKMANISIYMASMAVSITVGGCWGGGGMAVGKAGLGAGVGCWSLSLLISLRKSKGPGDSLKA